MTTAATRPGPKWAERPSQRQRLQPAMSCGRTGTRLMARPVAARMALAMAGVTEMHGGSPTPFAPSGAIGSGSSTKRGHDGRSVEERRAASSR